MPINKYVVKIPRRSGIARDTALNTFYVDQATPAASVETALSAFYTHVATGATTQLSGYFQNSIALTPWEIDVYELPTTLTGPTGPPIDIRHVTGTVSFAASVMPAQVSAVLSYHALYDSVPEHAPGARPRARYRGRVFIGPLSANGLTNSSDPNQECRLTNTFMNDLGAAAKAFATACGGHWMVFSRKNAAVYPVIGGWADDDPDIQRRRRVDKLNRIPWTYP